MTRTIRTEFIVNLACDPARHMSGPGGARVEFSCEADWARVHHLRHACDGILVGAGTVRMDDPSLRAKGHLKPNHPRRFILDPRRSLDEGFKVFQEEDPALRIVLRDHKQFGDLLAGEGDVDWETIREELGAKGIHHVLVEGGATVLNSILEQDAWDQWTEYVRDRGVEKGVQAPLPRAPFEEAVLGEGVLRTYERVARKFQEPDEFVEPLV